MRVNRRHCPSAHTPCEALLWRVGLLETLFYAVASDLLVCSSDHHGDARRGALAHPHLFGGVLLPHGLSGDFDRHVRAGRGRSLFLRRGELEGAALHQTGTAERPQQLPGSAVADGDPEKGGRAHHLEPGADLLHHGAAIFCFGHDCVAGRFRDHGAHRPGLLFRPAGRRRRLSAADPVAQPVRRAMHRGLSRHLLRGSRRYLAQHGRVGDRPGRQRGAGARTGGVPHV